MKHLLHPGYFPNIATFAVIAQEEVCWEVEDNFQKQTYRNRCYICADRGKLMMNLPIIHVGKEKGRQFYKDIRLDNHYLWQRQQWRTLQTAYRSSPFFEYYEDEIAPLYEKEHNFLMDFNLKTIECITECLQINMPSERTSDYKMKPTSFIDTRFLISAKLKVNLEQSAYVQVFSDRHGFIENVSVLDLLFNEGTNALTYLKNLNINTLHA